jgi:hypothetical protein
MAGREVGSAIQWALRADCYFGSEVRISVETTENGVRRGYFTMAGERINETKTQIVSLAPKAPCVQSTVRVIASYRYMDLGDRQSTERVIVYDPNNNCGDK